MRQEKRLLELEKKISNKEIDNDWVISVIDASGKTVDSYHYQPKEKVIE